jgi:filamentous hemagglutinin family protein
MKSRPLALFLAITCFGTVPVLAAPSNPVVVSGTASFNQTSPALTVTNSNGATINWNNFSIPAGSTTRFVQSSPSSAVLNRVLANDPSRIYGTLSSNGRVFLVNPAGIMVGPGGRIDTARVIAPRFIPAPSAPIAAPAPPLAVPPPRGALATAASVSSTRMVDGAVTLRTPLVDASPILYR